MKKKKRFTIDDWDEQIVRRDLPQRRWNNWTIGINKTVGYHKEDETESNNINKTWLWPTIKKTPPKNEK